MEPGVGVMSGRDKRNRLSEEADKSTVVIKVIDQIMEVLFC